MEETTKGLLGAGILLAIVAGYWARVRGKGKANDEPEPEPPSLQLKLPLQPASPPKAESWLSSIGNYVAQASQSKAQPMTPNPSPKPQSGVYFTDPADTALGAVGTIDGKRYMFEPLRDTKTGLAARLIYSDAQATLKRHGFRLLTEAEWNAQVKDPSSLILNPCTLTPGSSMASLAYAQKHDACVKKQLDAAGWSGDRFVVNYGKQWLDDPENRPKPGGSVNFGWFRTSPGPNSKGVMMPKGTPIQTPGRAHEASYTDYSQLTQGIEL